MSLAYDILGALFAVMVLGSGIAKLAGVKQIVESITGIGVPLRMFPFLAGCEIAGAIGLVVGLWYPPLGIAAAIGLVLYFLGAVGAHLRKNDFKGVPAAAFMLVAAVAVLVLRVLSA